MKKIIIAAVLSMVAAYALAERADALKPVKIDYDTADVDQVTQTTILTGKVVITRGTLTLKSDKALLKETPEGYMTVTLTADPGKISTFRQKRDGGPDLWIEGQAERIEYDERAELVKLFSNAVVKQLENGRLQSEVDGAFIAYDNRKETAAVRNSATGENKVGGSRNSMILSPRRTVAPAPAAQAPAPAPAPAQGKP
jgi:lipopolysaccharide export system protein LptA